MRNNARHLEDVRQMSGDGGACASPASQSKRWSLLSLLSTWSMSSQSRALRSNRAWAFDRARRAPRCRGVRRPGLDTSQNAVSRRETAPVLSGEGCPREIVCRQTVARAAGTRTRAPVGRYSAAPASPNRCQGMDARVAGAADAGHQLAAWGRRRLLVVVEQCPSSANLSVRRCDARVDLGATSARRHRDGRPHELAEAGARVGPMDA